MQLDGAGEYMRSIRSMVKDVVLEIQGFRSFFATSEGRKEAYDKEMLNELMGIRNELKSLRMEVSLISEVMKRPADRRSPLAIVSQPFKK